jgi:hypothetical protein
MKPNIRPLAILLAVLLATSAVSHAAAIPTQQEAAQHGAAFLPSQEDLQDQSADTLATKKKKKKKKKKSYAS